MINIKYISKRIMSLLVAGATMISVSSCSNKKDDRPEKIKEYNHAYSIEKYKDIPYLYSIKSYDLEKAKGTIYEMKKIHKSYNIKCTPVDFGKYAGEKDITWEDVRNTINNSKFDEYHKDVLLKGVNNLEKNNFNANLSTLNYNIKNIEIEYADSYQRDGILGEFNCFEHKITLSKKIENQNKYKEVFLHEMLGHGSTDAYLDDSKVYCSIDTPTYVTNTKDNFIGYSLYGEAFTEAMAQIIAITALDKELSEEHQSGYDLDMVELLMLCKDNKCSISDYANYGVNKLIEKMKENGIDNPYNLIAMISYNHESAITANEMEILSEQLMYEYFCERIDDEQNKGKTTEELNKDMQYVFGSYYDYVLTFENNNRDDIVAYNVDYINITRLYEDIGHYAYTNSNMNKIKK